MDDRAVGPLPAASPPAPGTFGVRILGVSEVTRAVKAAVREDPRLADLWVEGEVGRVTVSSAGHAYFALKDERSQLQCVWFRDDRLRSAFEAQVGLRVVAHGRIDLFEPQGALQLYVESLQPAGFGDLALRFEELKARLAAEGLFESERKRKLPIRPGGRSRSSPARRAPSGRTSRPCWPAAGRSCGSCSWPPRSRATTPQPASSRRSAGWSAIADAARGGRSRCRRAAGHDPRPWRRLARGPVGVQRRAGRAGRRGPPDPGRVAASATRWT